MAVTSAVKLRLYNGALRRIGSRALSALTDAQESRRVLDAAWGSADELAKWGLERGEWNFAIRGVQADYNPSVSPSFGFSRAFDKPDDFRRLVGLSFDAYFNRPLVNTEYNDEAGYWFTDYDIIYVRYVSDDTDYGLNDAAWTETFKDLLEAKLAVEICERLTNSKSLGDRLMGELTKTLKAAKAQDAMAEGVKFFPRGNWASSRAGNRGGE